MDASVCPLCGKQNTCGNLANEKNASSCWCQDEALSFPPSLFDKLPEAVRGKACVCKRCVLAEIELANQSNQ